MTPSRVFAAFAALAGAGVVLSAQTPAGEDAHRRQSHWRGAVNHLKST
jgi:hypothetical protein